MIDYTTENSFKRKRKFEERESLIVANHHMIYRFSGIRRSLIDNKLQTTHAQR